jgi:hypothetical protein
MIGMLFAFLSFFSSLAYSLTVCDAVSAGYNINVRSDHTTSATLLATMGSGSIGSIQTGPATADGYIWWYVTWLSGQSGWSAEKTTSGSEVYLNFVPPSPLVYTDSIGIGWCLNPWPNTSVTALSAPSRVGSYSVKTVTTAPWARLYLKTNAESTVGFNSLRFSVRSESSSGQILYVGLYNTSGSVIHYVNVWDYVSGGTLAPNTWYDVRIPIAGATELNAANQTIGGFVVESGQAATFYVDDVALDTASGTTKWVPPTSTITGVSVSCSPSSIQTNQTSQCSANVSGTGNYNSEVNWTANTGAMNASGLFAAPTSATTALITATSVQDNTKSGSTNVTVTAPPPPTISQAGAMVYSETVGFGWFSGGWANTTNNFVSPNSYRGINGIEMKTTSQWGRTQILASPNFIFNTTNFGSLSIALNIGGYELEDLYVSLLNANGTAIHYENIKNYVVNGTLHSYLWNQVRVPLSVLNGVNSNVYGVEIQSTNPATLYFDEMQFEPTGTNGGCQ